jgi:hypothetical protein
MHQQYLQKRKKEDEKGSDDMTSSEMDIWRGKGVVSESYRCIRGYVL